MPLGRRSIGRRALFGFAAALAFGAGSVQATPYLVVDADSDQVLMQNEATAPWYPASLTKLMTVYVALDAVRTGKLTLDTPLIMSARAARMPPSKMGFRPGTQVTLDNALKMLMVKSPNDVAVMVAEGVSGSVEAFADDMNADAQRLGMHESHFVNPNGLHNPDHVSSARDMASGVSSVSLPLRTASKATYTVISLVSDAGYHGAVASFSINTWSLSASTTR